MWLNKSFSPLFNTHKTFYMLLNNCTYRGVTMFGLGKKKGTPVASTASKPMFDDEIDLIPESIPDELPPLEIKSKVITMPMKDMTSVSKEMPLFPEIPQQQMEVVSKQQIVRRIEPRNKFIEQQQFKSIMSGLHQVVMDFDNVDIEIEKSIELKDMKYEKMDGLQSTLEEVSKKLMQIDATLFGG